MGQFSDRRFPKHFSAATKKEKKKKKSDTNKCTHVLESVASPPDDVSQAEDGTVGGALLVVATSLQIVLVGRLKNIGPSKSNVGH